MSNKTGNDGVLILASAARSATSDGTAEIVTSGLGGYAAAAFTLDVTAAATDAIDTLNVFVQTQLPSGEWLDIVHFTEVLGNGGAKTHVGKVFANVAETMFETGAALAEGAVRNILGEHYRVRYAIVDADSDASFTFSVGFTGMAT